MEKLREGRLFWKEKTMEEEARLGRGFSVSEGEGYGSFGLCLVKKKNRLNCGFNP